jgi:hypothetical protein
MSVLFYSEESKLGRLPVINFDCGAAQRRFPNDFSIALEHRDNALDA